MIIHVAFEFLVASITSIDSQPYCRVLQLSVSTHITALDSCAIPRERPKAQTHSSQIVHCNLRSGSFSLSPSTASSLPFSVLLSTSALSCGCGVQV